MAKRGKRFHVYSIYFSFFCVCVCVLPARRVCWLHLAMMIQSDHSTTRLHILDYPYVYVPYCYYILPNTHTHTHGRVYCLFSLFIWYFFWRFLFSLCRVILIESNVSRTRLAFAICRLVAFLHSTSSIFILCQLKTTLPNNKRTCLHVDYWWTVRHCTFFLIVNVNCPFVPRFEASD